MSGVLTCGKHASGNMLLDATMSPPDPCQRHVLASVLVPLLDVMWAKAGFQSNLQEPLIPISQPTSFVATVTAGNKVRPHPEQGGEQITEAYLREMTEVECIWRFRYVSQVCT